jgi:Flp pilus assembly protein TadD
MRAHVILATIAALALEGCGATVFPGIAALSSSSHNGGRGSASQDELALAQSDFRNQNFGLAERRYRKLVESEPTNANAWLGLGSVDDELSRFDLADKDYEQVAKLSGVTPELLNDRGYSYMMRGDLRRAARFLKQAHAMDPTNKFIAGNLRALAQKQAPGSALSKL